MPSPSSSSSAGWVRDRGAGGSGEHRRAAGRGAVLVYDDPSWCESEAARAERIVYLIGAVAEAAAAAVVVVARVESALADQSPARTRRGEQRA
jgi:hypothetical protein